MARYGLQYKSGLHLLLGLHVVGLHCGEHLGLQTGCQLGEQFGSQLEVVEDTGLLFDTGSHTSS